MKKENFTKKDLSQEESKRNETEGQKEISIHKAVISRLEAKHQNKFDKWSLAEREKIDGKIDAGVKRVANASFITSLGILAIVSLITLTANNKIFTAWWQVGIIICVIFSFVGLSLFFMMWKSNKKH